MLCRSLLYRNSLLPSSPFLLSRTLLQPSIVPTFHFQKGLPRLPVPSLEESCSKYLKHVTPLLSPEEASFTSAEVNKFSEGIGKDLQRKLEEKNKENPHTSFIADIWYDMYLSDRRSIVLNSNPFLCFKEDPKRTNQVDRAASLVHSALKFRKLLKENKLEPEIYHTKPERSKTKLFQWGAKLLPPKAAYGLAYTQKAYPLDMVQYPSLFGVTRVPHLEKDSLRPHPHSTHLAVMRGASVWKVPVLDKHGGILPEEVIKKSLQQVVDAETENDGHNSPGLLTSMERNRWASLRESLLKSSADNVSSLHEIESALFTLCLDPVDPSSPADLSAQFLHGLGQGRWFDSSFQLIVTPDGTSGINFEHSWGDGVAVLRFANEIYADSCSSPLVTQDKSDDQVSLPSDLKKLNFDLNTTEELSKGLNEARETLQSQADKLNLTFLHYNHEGFGKDAIKKAKLSPDGVVQMAIQVAYHRQYNKVAATYESASTAAFLHGRTETIRPLSTESLEMVQAFAEARSKGEEWAKENHSFLMDKLKAAVSAHSKFVFDAATGKGFDRHLFALKHMASQESQELPGMFTDPAYARLNHIILSTSTLTSPSVTMGGFGPVVEDGYGIGYGVYDSRVGAHVTSYKPAEEANDFLRNLHIALFEMQCLLKGETFVGKTPPPIPEPTFDVVLDGSD